MSEFVYLAQLSVPGALDEKFNETYDTRYLPQLLKVPGVRAVTRYRLEWADNDGVPPYLAVYELDAADIPRSQAWREASARSGWADLIRPHLTTRRHGMFRRLG